MTYTKEQLMIKVEEWRYTYDNYPTMMSSKKAWEKGILARELADDLLTSLTEIK